MTELSFHVEPDAWVPVAELLTMFHPHNSQTRNPAELAAIKRHLSDEGFMAEMIVVNPHNKKIVSGHGRTQAAHELGYTGSLPVVYREYKTEAEHRRAMLRWNLARGHQDEAKEAAEFAALLTDFDRLDLAADFGMVDGEFEALLAEFADEPADDDTDPDTQIQDFPVADLLAPYPYFGGKRGIAGAVWARFGQVDNYVEPFFGSGAMLLSRPNVGGLETVNDFDGFIANFWRAVAADPEGVAHHVDWPVNENDLMARHLWLVAQGAEMTRRLDADPDFYDSKAAGWWCWGACNWIGTGWCSGDGPWRVDGDEVRQLPHLGNAGQGVNRQLPHLGNAGQGVNRKLPHLGDAGRGVTDGQCADWSAHLSQMMQALSDRLRRVRVACGDWSRVVTPSVTDRHGLTAVFLDPPYAAGAMEYSAGGNKDDSLTRAVQEWAIANGENPLLRIALCGYDPLPLAMPAGWVALRWTARKGYQNAENAANSSREIVWFSPHCEKPELLPNA